MKTLLVNRQTRLSYLTSLVAYEDLKIANMVRNHKLAKSISDAAWGRFLAWVNYYAALHAIPVIAVAPQFTSQDCSACGTLVKKSLSVRTHVCHHCGLVLDRDQNAAVNILQKAYRTVGQTGTGKHQACETLLDIRPLLSTRKGVEQAG